ncbi:MAG: glycosyltransferase [Candidatus Eisenbacteria bacterium]|nr:glycosyltransferase [Candidatus Eisenbacteria bacterium]
MLRSVKDCLGIEGRYHHHPPVLPDGRALESGVTVVIPTWNGAGLLAACLGCVAAQELRPSRTLVVDNASTDATEEVVRGFQGIHLTRLAENVGYSGALASVFSQVRTAYVAVLNNDARPEPDWLSRLARHLDTGPRRGCAFPLTVREDGTIDTAGDLITLAGFGYKRGHRCRDLSPAPAGVLVCAPGVAPLYRTAAVVAAGGWDPGLHSQWDDLDLGIRLWLLGWDSILDEGVRVVHYQGSSSSRRVRTREFLAARNEMVVLLKTMPPGVCALMAPAHVSYLALSLCSHIIQGTAPAFLAGKAAGIASLGAIIAARRRLTPSRTLHVRQLDRRWMRVWWGLSRLGGRHAPGVP